MAWGTGMTFFHDIFLEVLCQHSALIQVAKWAMIYTLIDGW